MTKTERYWLAKKVTLIGAFVNILLSIIKMITGIIYHSHALFADGIHSFADLFADAMVLIGSKYGSQDADDTHPYGHQRIETLTTLILSLILILAGVGIAWDAINEIIHRTSEIPKLQAIPIAIISIVANELLFYYMLYIGKQIQSNLIIANAWHRRSDSGSSLVVLIGLIGSLLGYSGFDALAAVIVSILIAKMGIEYGWHSVKELIDTAIDPEMLKQIESIIHQIDGVLKIHQLRSRSMGGDIYIDVHIQVSPWITVSEGHYIAQHVHLALMNTHKTIKDVTVHVDPEDDETSNPSLHLPNRTSLETGLFQPLQEKIPEIQYWLINYLDGKIILDVYSRSNLQSTQYEQISQALKPYGDIIQVRYFIVANSTC